MRAVVNYVIVFYAEEKLLHSMWPWAKETPLVGERYRKMYFSTSKTLQKEQRPKAVSYLSKADKHRLSRHLVGRIWKKAL